MLDHQSEITENVLESVSESTIDIHQIVEEDLDPIPPNEPFNKGEVWSPHLDGVLKSGKGVGCNLYRGILPRSTASVEYGTDVELDLTGWLGLVKDKEVRQLLSIDSTLSPLSILVDKDTERKGRILGCLCEHSGHQHHASVEVVIQELLGRV